MSFSWDFPYRSQRAPVLADNAVATSQPLAAQAGLAMIRGGGNAVDAAIASAAALTVVEPTSNGVGSDAFAIVWDGETLHGLNGSGRSPAELDECRFEGLASMPMTGWDAVTVPGAVAAWADLWARFGSLPFEDLLEPAIRYASDGFPVSPITSAAWARAGERFSEFPAFREAFLPQGRAPRPGERFACPDLAHTLDSIASTRGKTLYVGALAEAIVRSARESKSPMKTSDLADHRSEWVEPLSAPFGDLALHELPPNGQGIAALVALSVLHTIGPVEGGPDDGDPVHVQIEAMKIGLADAFAHVADPRSMTVAPSELLERNRIENLASAIRLDRALPPPRAGRGEGGTVYITAADASGLMVSLIQSNYQGFGSGVVIPGTGISLQNRGFGFTLSKSHPNRVQGGKRPFHTIIPAFVTRGGSPVMSFGVMGGHMQAQGHVQMMVRIFGHGQNPQAASDAPRWQVLEDFRIAFEEGFP
ncbi:MAG: gamma-glutamyltransferase family protein, partial [Planctomycetota bacterium]